MRFGNSLSIFLLFLSCLFLSFFNSSKKIFLLAFFLMFYATLTHIGIFFPLLFFILYSLSLFLFRTFIARLTFLNPFYFLLFTFSSCIFIFIPISIDPNFLIESLSTLFPIRSSNYLFILESNSSFRAFDMVYLIFASILFFLINPRCLRNLSFRSIFSLSLFLTSFSLFLLAVSPVGDFLPIVYRYIPVAQLFLIFSFCDYHLFRSTFRSILVFVFSLILSAQSFAYLF